MRMLLRGVMTAGLAVLALAGCEQPGPLYVDQAWVQLNANPEAPAAGYFVVHGGPDDVTLRDVSTDAVERLEMHESMTGGNHMTSMKPLDTVAIPAKTDIAFAPGGKHLMLWGVNPDVAATGKLTFTFIFSNGDRLPVDAVIRKAGAGSPVSADKAAEHTGH